MSPATIALNIILGIIVFGVPRKYFLLPFIAAVCLVPMNQRLIIAGLDFPVLRILVLCSMIRLFSRGELRNIQWNSFDKLILVWNITGTIIYTVLWGNMNAVIYKCGVMYDCLGMYWLFRQTIRSWDDIYSSIKLLAIFAIVSAPLIAAEKIMQSSFYSFFGPVGAKFHRGRFRCAGPFPHYIMMGCFWASLMPLLYSMVKVSKSKVFYWMAIFAAFACVFFSASSTPLMMVAAMVIFWMLNKYRSKGKQIFISICGLLLCLHFVMKAPVWHLMARANVFGGSTGWHRYYLFDMFIENISEWFLLGVKSTAHWGMGLGDVTNQYVLEAVRGGFLTMAIFIIIVYMAIKISGKYSLLSKDKSVRWLCWGICVSLLGHVTSFWGVSYFGQIIVQLYLIFAIVGFIFEQLITESILQVSQNNE